MNHANPIPAYRVVAVRRSDGERVLLVEGVDKARAEELARSMRREDWIHLVELIPPGVK